MTGVPKIDDDGEFSDVFVRTWISGNEKNKKETDTHWRCSTGDPSFNCRIILDFESPNKFKKEDEAYILKIEVYDRDLL